MQKIISHLWFDNQALEAAKFYTSVFTNSETLSQVQIEGTPSGNADIVTIRLEGSKFQLINGGPFFQINPSVSFSVACESVEEVNELFAKFEPGSTILMPLQKYDFSDQYVWLQDKYGLSWQISKTNSPIVQKITPSLMFVGENCGKAEEAIKFYTSSFPDSKLNFVSKYGENAQPNIPEDSSYIDFKLFNRNFSAMDSRLDHKFNFNEAISFIIYCDDQAEIDKYWSILSAVPESEQCGWLKDKYGFSWQIVPSIMDEMMNTKDKNVLNRVTQAFLKMKKFDIAKLEQAFKGQS